MSRLYGQARRASRCAALMVFVCGAFAANVSHAALGDQTGMTPAAVTSVLNGAAFERSYTDAGGTTIHEYSTSTGQVFAYTWEGPTAPNLHTLLGGRFAGYRNASAQMRALRADLHIQHVASNDVMVESGGAMRDYLGRAWLPAHMPSGVSISDLE